MKINSVLTSVKTFSSKKVGRGIGSGKGKTAGRGHKGQGSRSGVSLALVEGGQQSFLRALPKRGFKSMRNRRGDAIINLAQIKNLVESGVIENGCNLSKSLMCDVGLIKKSATKIKLLSSDCDYGCNVKICYDEISLAAKEKLKVYNE